MNISDKVSADGVYSEYEGWVCRYADSAEVVYCTNVYEDMIRGDEDFLREEKRCRDRLKKKDDPKTDMHNRMGVLLFSVHMYCIKG